MLALEYRREMLDDSQISRPTYKTFLQQRRSDMAMTKRNPYLFASKSHVKATEKASNEDIELAICQVYAYTRGPFENTASEASCVFASTLADDSLQASEHRVGWTT
jgi:hypothetical protein